MRIASILVGATLVVAALSAQTLPQPSGAINDFAHVLTDESRTTLTTLVEAVENDTTAEIAVATVTSLEGLSVEEYANKLFNAWGVGQQAKDNGVLVLIAPTAREIRIEVGYGLEGVLPDGLAGAIIRDEFIPRFREGDFNGGIVRGVTRVAEVVRKGERLTPEQIAALEQSAGFGIPWWVIVPFMGIFVVIGSFMFGVGLRNKGSFEKIWGGCFGGIPLLMSSIFIPWSFFVLGGLALVLCAIGYRKGLKGFESGHSMASDTHDMSPGSWRSGSSRSSSSSSWSSGSSSSSSSSSSFGGGSSGGGGASGRW